MHQLSGMEPGEDRGGLVLKKLEKRGLIIPSVVIRWVAKQSLKSGKRRRLPRIVDCQQLALRIHLPALMHPDPQRVVPSGGIRPDPCRTSVRGDGT